MIDVVAFLIEHFSDIHSCPPIEDLGAILEQEGFDNEAISGALMCVHLLNELPLSFENGLEDSSAMRIYHAEETEALSTDIRALLHFLNESGSINAQQREFVIHALMHLPYDEITLDNAKVLTLLVLWAHRCELPVLIGDELMAAVHGKGIMQ